MGQGVLPRGLSRIFLHPMTLSPRSPRVLLAVFGLGCTASAGSNALVDTTRSPNAVMYMPDLADVRWNGGLLGERFDVARNTMVPHMGEILRSATDSHAWRLA